MAGAEADGGRHSHVVEEEPSHCSIHKDTKSDHRQNNGGGEEECGKASLKHVSSLSVDGDLLTQIADGSEVPQDLKAVAGDHIAVCALLQYGHSHAVELRGVNVEASGYSGKQDRDAEHLGLRLRYVLKLEECQVRCVCGGASWDHR